MKGSPLAGIRVVDFSHSWAGPHCGRLLADFGAEVIKIEYPKLLCLLRGGRKEKAAYDRHVAWHQVNRNKYSVTLDLDDGEDRKVLCDLVGTADVFVENSRPGVMERLGFGYADLCRIKSDIIMLSMSAFGASGPFAGFVGYGAVMEAIGGMQSLTAYEKGAKPARIKELDVINGTAGACAVMTALLFRQQSGQGQHIDLSQMEAATHTLIGEHLLEFVMNGKQRLPVGNGHWKYAPQGCYPCLGEDKWLAVTITNEDEWQRLCVLLNRRDWLADRRFAGNENRQSQRELIDSEIGKWTSRYSPREAMEILQGHGIAAGAVLDVKALADDPCLGERHYFVQAAEEPAKLFMGMPFRMSGGVGRVRWKGPDLGQHNEKVLRGLLGMDGYNEKKPGENDIKTAFEL